MTGVFLKGKEIITLDVDGHVQPFAESVATSAVTKHEFPGQLPDLTEEQPVLYTGACDCGAIQVAVRSKPLSDVEIKEDNCSICIRNGTVGLYPHQSQVTIAGGENTRDYAFGRKFNGAPFCQTCGVHCFGNLYGPPKEIVAKLPEAKQEFVRKQLEVQPLNIRVLDKVDWAEMDIKWSNEGTAGYQLKD
ncbi:hypothetical protein C8035_v006979 [Colletotrichum spinosum]|uniref:CENP-V/GFA domain-containing protein n=1 Tax=Colletotrichum spinosum TaxID=1347390 RepID=A0A4R8QJS0_9PEZI|nr:hypothetical protein C8035_v006979 [Colletotrichum spinosum]